LGLSKLAQPRVDQRVTRHSFESLCRIKQIAAPILPRLHTKQTQEGIDGS
jgi:hypothetical protein